MSQKDNYQNPKYPPFELTFVPRFTLNPIRLSDLGRPKVLVVVVNVYQVRPHSRALFKKL